MFALGGCGGGDIDGFFRAAVDAVDDAGGADSVIVLHADGDGHGAAEHGGEVGDGRGEFDARRLVGGDLEEIAGAGEGEAVAILDPREAVAAGGGGGFGEGEGAAVFADFEREVFGVVAVEGGLADRGVEGELPVGFGFLRDC